MKLMKKLENVFAAAAFAEAGEFETAKEMIRETNETKPHCKEPACEHDEHHDAAPSSSRA